MIRFPKLYLLLLLPLISLSLLLVQAEEEEEEKKTERVTNVDPTQIRFNPPDPKVIITDTDEYNLPETVRFNRDIRTIMSRTCFACHGPDDAVRMRDLSLHIREEAMKPLPDGGQIPIIPGDPKNSYMIKLINSPDPKTQMPPIYFHFQLSDRDKAMLYRWIKQGAEYEPHWAFIPPETPELPQPDSRTHPIDQFVRQKAEIEGIELAPPADRNTLIRRVTQDLTGLPPTPEEVHAFVKDTADDTTAYEKVVDRLLNTTAYGEQRTRYWLDTARYADTGGYQYDKIRHQWVWRDWVIHAFNSNMPFDRFTILQNAGDLLPNATPQTRLATGFHRNHPITIEGGIIEEEYRTEYVMDRVVTTSTAWMGLTYLCARCHDHKYDPIPQEDFYAFYAFFNNVPERGHNGFDPREKIESPLENGWRKRITEATQKFDAALRRHRMPVANWESQLKQASDAYSLVRPDAIEADHPEITFTPQPDGSLLVGGANPDKQTYQIDFHLERAGTQVLRLEALTDESLVNNSVGRAFNGNFVLTEFEVYVGAATANDESLRRVDIENAVASYSQRGYEVTKAYDKILGNTGWAVDGNLQAKAREVAFHLSEPLEAGSRVRVRMVHDFGQAHSVGRLRLTIPKPGSIILPADIAEILNKQPNQRNETEQSDLRRYLALRYGPPAVAEKAGDVQLLIEQYASSGQEVPTTMVMAEMKHPRTVYVLDRGEYDKPVKDHEIKPGIPSALGGLSEKYPRNRLGLAQWLVAPENPLTARVTVNRFWSQIFGVGIVKTVEDFGSQGEYPMHPDLLDWLALDFVNSGWDVKQLFKTMVMSETYRRSSVTTPEQYARDPENRFLARGPRFRLDAEAIRDAALFASGLLDKAVGGPSVYPYHPEGLWMEVNNRPGYSRAYPHTKDANHLYRRSMYTYWKRAVPPPSMDAFDAPNREFCVVQRSRTNTPLQALNLLHDPQYIEAARNLGQRMMQEGGRTLQERLVFAFRVANARDPQSGELARLQAAYERNYSRFRDQPKDVDQLLAVGESNVPPDLDRTELATCTAIARLLLNLSEFITKE